MNIHEGYHFIFWREIGRGKSSFSFSDKFENICIDYVHITVLRYCFVKTNTERMFHSWLTTFYQSLYRVLLTFQGKLWTI